MSACVEYSIDSYKTSELSQKEYEKLVKEIFWLYEWFAPGSTDKHVYERLCGHSETIVDTIFSVAKRKVVAFSVYYTEAVAGARVMFRNGTVVGGPDADERKKGHYKTLLGYSVPRQKPDFLAAKTQNPRIYKAMRGFAHGGVAYPSPNGHMPTPQVVMIAKHFSHGHALEPVSLILPNLYESIRKESEFKTVRAENQEVAEMFAKLGRNDGYFVIVPVSSTQA